MMRTALALLLVAALSGCAAPEAAPDHAPDAAEPSFGLVTLDGEPWSLPVETGTTVVLDFMEPYCSACRAQMPDLLDAYARLEAVSFLSVDISATTFGPGTWDRDALLDYRDRYGAPWAFAPDLDGSLMVHYTIDATPTLLVLDHDLDELGRHVGNGLDGAALAAWVDEVRASPDGPAVIGRP